jgi:hypothetical protein
MILTATTARRTSLLAETRFNAAESVVAVGADFAGVDAAHAPVDFVGSVSTFLVDLKGGLDKRVAYTSSECRS